jgi:N-acylglucosamine-6-phosphate 2-epimerase
MRGAYCKVKLKRENKWSAVDRLSRTLIVSCQASVGEPLCAPTHIAALALSAIAGGAKALRLEGEENVRALRPLTDLPIIGLTKSKNVSSDQLLEKVYITATFREAEALALAGADIIAIDATGRPRADGYTVESLIMDIHNRLNKPVMADISTVEEALVADRFGADLISTTLYGYTRETYQPSEIGPGFSLIKELAGQVLAPLILEGRVWYPEEVTSAFEYGAFAVVVGSAITRPQLITQRFAKAIPQGKARVS